MDQRILGMTTTLIETTQRNDRTSDQITRLTRPVKRRLQDQPKDLKASWVTKKDQPTTKRPAKRLNDKKNN